MRIKTLSSHVELDNLTANLWVAIGQIAALWQQHGMQTLIISGAGPKSAQPGTPIHLGNAVAIRTSCLPDEFGMYEELEPWLDDYIAVARCTGYWLVSDIKPY